MTGGLQETDRRRMERSGLRPCAPPRASPSSTAPSPRRTTRPDRTATPCSSRCAWTSRPSPPSCAVPPPAPAARPGPPGPAP
ncbi:hypothetical protein ACFQVA_41290 [Actinomadura keratinilytica]